MYELFFSFDTIQYPKSLILHLGIGKVLIGSLLGHSGTGTRVDFNIRMEFTFYMMKRNAQYIERGTNRGLEAIDILAR